MSTALDELIFNTDDDSKVRLFETVLSDLPIRVVQKNLDIPEIQSLDPSEVAVGKAQWAFERLRRPVIVEGAGLEIDELDDFPGALIKPIIRRVKAEGICRFADMTRHRYCGIARSVAHADSDGRISIFMSREIGWRIAEHPCIPARDSSVFDELSRVLIPSGFDHPLAELNREEQAEVQASCFRASCYTDFADWLRTRL